MKLKFRTLRADEICVRVQSAKENGAILLLYKDSRCDMAILDETVGALNWQRRHTRENHNCVVSIYDGDKNAWVEKEDTGTESDTEAQKGLASDSFKRACTNWGIGRELYTSPFVWVRAGDAQIGRNKAGKPACYDNFSVKRIEYDDNKRISVLEIYNDTLKRPVFSFGCPRQQAQTSSPQKLTDDDKRKITMMEIKNIMDAAHFTEAERAKFREMMKSGTPIDAVRSLVEQAAQDKAIIQEAENGN